MDWMLGISVVALSAVGAALGTFLKEYFGSRGRKEGEIDAIAKNLAEVLRQLRETTKTSEESRLAVSGQLEHDRTLFGRYDGLLSEETIKEAVNGELYAKYTSTRFTNRLSSFVRMAKSDGGAFLSPSVQEPFLRLSSRMGELQAFIARHFFRPHLSGPADDEGHYALELYPEFRHADPEPGKPNWDERAEELDQLCDQVAEAYGAYRRAAKEALLL